MSVIGISKSSFCTAKGILAQDGDHETTEKGKAEVCFLLKNLLLHEDSAQSLQLQSQELRLVTKGMPVKSDRVKNTSAARKGLGRCVCPGVFLLDVSHSAY